MCNARQHRQGSWSACYSPNDMANVDPQVSMLFFELCLECSSACFGLTGSKSLEFLFKKRVMSQRMRHKGMNKAEPENLCSGGWAVKKVEKRREGKTICRRAGTGRTQCRTQPDVEDKEPTRRRQSLPTVL
jgi:hypothetical protein